MMLRFWLACGLVCLLPLQACGQGGQGKASAKPKAKQQVKGAQPKAAVPVRPQTAKGMTTPEQDQPMTEEQKILYSLGVSIMRSLMPFALTDKELTWVQQGMSDGLEGEFEIDPTPYEAKINSLADSRVSRVVEAQKKIATERVAQEAAKPGARVLESGLIFRTVKPGQGKSPSRKSLVTVHYKGALADGTVFDSSYARAEPTNFPVEQVIPCWTEALQLMKAGGKAHLVCPSHIAYGSTGAPPAIPPGATLFFEVELLKIK